VIGAAPILFWILATGTEVAQRKPDALEDLLGWLAATWVFYFPVFALTGGLVMTLGRLFVPPARFSATTIYAAVGAGGSVLSLVLASVVYRLPTRAWPFCLVVGAAMGWAFKLARTDDCGDSQQGRR